MLAEPKRFRVEVWTICYDFFLLTELRFSMVLILLVGPRLISQDLRFNAQPLYFSRPLRRINYLLGKLGIIAAFLVARRDLMDVIARLAGEGRSVLVSTHVLHDVASLTYRIVLMNRGRLVAEGEVRQIRCARGGSSTSRRRARSSGGPTSGPRDPGDPAGPDVSGAAHVPRGPLTSGTAPGT